MSYILTPQEYKNLKTRLSKVVKTKHAKNIIDECEKALNIFEEKGYPDDWSNWERAKEDAMMSITYGFSL